MIDFENYERVTVRNEQNKNVLKDVDMGDLYSNLSKIEQISVEYALDRLAELEDLIEKGRLVPMYSIEQDKPYGFWLIGFYKKDYFSFVCSTKEEAKAKLKKLMESED